MASLGSGFYASCGVSVIWCLLCVLLAQPLEKNDQIFPMIEFAKTKDGRDVYWIEDHRHRIVQIRVQFDSGVGDCASLIQTGWNDHHDVMNKKLLNMGGYARFWMGGNTSFIEISIFESHEKEGLRWIRSFVDRALRLDVVIEKDRMQDFVADALYEREEINIDRKECMNRYRAWKKSHTPQFLLSGSTNMMEILPFLNFFWPESIASKDLLEPQKRKERMLEQHSIVNDDLGAQVELFLLVPLPSKDFVTVRVYQHILDGGFGGRLMNKLREEKGWVYDVHTKIHYGPRILLEISTQCSIEDLLVVRDGLYSVLYRMNHVQNEEMERYRWDRIKKRREESLLGMPYLFSSIQRQDEEEITSKDMVEALAKKIDLEDVIWILRGRESFIRQAWPVDWNHVSFED